MADLNERITKVLKKEMWYLCSGTQKPVVLAAAFKEIANDGTLAVPLFYSDEFADAVEKSGKVAVSVADEKGMHGYQIKGKAEIIKNGDTAEKWKAIVEKHIKTTKSFIGVVKISPDKIIITTPGKHNNEEI